MTGPMGFDLRMPVASPPKYERRAASVKLTPFVEMVTTALLADARRPRKERRTAKALLKQIAQAGYEGGYTQLTDFIRSWRVQQGGVAIGKAFVPLTFELGEAFQFDWSEEALVIGGLYRKLQVSHMKLCASRAFWLVAYPSQGDEMLFDAHTRSFAALGGVARRGIYEWNGRLPPAVGKACSLPSVGLTRRRNLRARRHRNAKG
ncbi:hypothetical protein BH11PSE13_BH11PSE13_42780 [soil metagenome]